MTDALARHAAARRAAGKNAVEGVAVAAIICAAGSSSRMAGTGEVVKKEYRQMPGNSNRLTVLGAVVRAFAVLSEVKLIVIAVPDNPVTGETAARKAIPGVFLAGREPTVCFVRGGKTRRGSVFNALSVLPEKFPEVPNAKNYVLIHDGARPWVSPSFIRHIIAEVKHHPAVIPVMPVTETPKELTLCMGEAFASGRGDPIYVKHHLKRAAVAVAQTPQAFAFPEILDLHRIAAEHQLVTGMEFTDDAEIWGTFHGSVAVIPGDPKNRKITFPGDLA